jgi:hypothetical protein
MFESTPQALIDAGIYRSVCTLSNCSDDVCARSRSGAAAQ